MAELPKNIRKPGGALVSARSPFTRRVLLPTEADLCNLLGLTEEEYFQFLEGVAAKVKERPEAYGVVPSVYASGVELYIAGQGLTVLGQIVVGVSLSVAAYLLTPKPPSMKQGTNERTADKAGLKRFAPQFSFNSVQDLANLGDLIPLVFANRDQNSNGGIRVNSQLMWSQLVSLGSYQQLKLLGLFSLGEIEKRPDFEGFAIGDLLINNYHAKKIYKLNYLNDDDGPEGENIPFLRAGGIIPNNIFKIDDERYFSGTRNPTTQATFGLSNPMPNMTYYKLSYELVRTSSNPDTDEERPAGRITLKKRRKLLGSWPVRAGFKSGGDALQRSGDKDLAKGDIIEYQILGSGDLDENLYEGIGYQQNIETLELTMEPHGLEDVNAAVKTIRETTDSAITEDEQYMAGTTLVNCFQINESDQQWDGIPWSGTFHRHYYFEVLEEGRYHASPSERLDGNHTSNPNWDTNGKFFTVRPTRLDRDDHFYYEQIYNELYEPHIRYALQKATLGTISNNRKCDITEIGIKSKVYKQMTFANVNSKPEEDKIYEVFDNKSTLTLGQVNKYITRFSFFKLQVKIDNVWTWLQPDTTSYANHSGLFCVKGNTPEFQYNYIRIDHPGREEYEFRFFPWPGNDVIKDVIALENKPTSPKVRVCLLNANKATNVGELEQFSSNTFTVRFAGKRNYALTKSILSNPEWNLGHPSKNLVAGSSSTVIGFNKFHVANYDNPSASNLPTTTQSKQRWVKASHRDYGTITDGVSRPFEGPYHDTIIVRFDNYPRAGRITWSLYINPSDVTTGTQGYDGNAYWGSLETGSNVDAVLNTPATEFHYNYGTNGKIYGGKFQPVLVGGQNPFGISNWYYVKKSEQFGTIATPVINLSSLSLVNQSVSNTGDDGDPLASGLTISLKVWTNLDASGNVQTGNNLRWYALWDLVDPGSDYENGDKVRIPAQTYTGPNGTQFNFSSQQLILEVESSERAYSDDIEHKLNVYDAAADFWKYEGDQSSHLEGPEHQITYVNEIIKDTEDQATYENLAYAGLRVNSSKEWTNFSQFSAYFKKGIKVKSLLGGVDRATSLFPEIAYALLTDEKLGAGAVINVDSVNETNMTIAANFCKANSFFWDGVISNKVNLREFIFEQGTHCLLDFTIVGGQFSLYPSVPFDENTYEMKNDKDVVIKAMFTDGNIKDLQVAFLAPEDRQTFKANVIYRDEKENGFPENNSIVVRFHGTEYNDDPLETFDLSGFCTSSKHAKTFGKYILATRKFVDHTITFKTAPHFINGVQPGDYIRVFSTTQHVQRFNNGAILDDGTVVSKDTISGSKTFYYWNPSEEVVKEATENFSNPLPATYRGSLFTIKESEASDQCYKVESITFGEDGLIELSGSYAELDGNKLAMLQRWDDTDVNNPLFDYDLE